MLPVDNPYPYPSGGYGYLYPRHGSPVGISRHGSQFEVCKICNPRVGLCTYHVRTEYQLPAWLN